ncbi:MAG: hypothetical protein GQ477_00550, partial [Nanohaloarchaea archaeon]|nr:hypothetical protein [Candidatus Nanohaloarchaea archaeon]
MQIEFMISLKEQYMNAIENKTKLHEFRRRFSKINHNFYSLIYVSAPISKITAIIKFNPPLEGNIDDMLALRQTHSFSNDQAIINYFKGSKTCHALPISQIHILKNPIPLNKLRDLVPNFAPPQSYFRIDNDKYSVIIDY